MNLNKELEISKKLAIISGHKIMEIYLKDFDIEYKDNDSPLTEADTKSNEIIVKELIKEFPEYSILSEESSDDLKRLKNDWCWIVDPLDGTKEFIKKNGEFTVNIALSYKKRPVVGVIYVPVKDKLYFASKDKGAYLLKASKKKEKIKVSDKTSNITLVMSRSHASDFVKNIIKKKKVTKTKRAGSSLKGCMVAEGKAEVYYRYNPTMEWDTAAMQCIVEEAGGVFKQLDDSEMMYNREDSKNRKGFYILNDISNKLH